VRRVKVAAQPVINKIGKSFKQFFHIIPRASHKGGRLVKLDFNT